MVTIHFYIIVIILMKKLMGFETVRLPTLFFYIPQMKEKHRGLEQHVKKWWKNFHFGVNWPFKCLLQYRYIYINTLMNEWMHRWCIYIALYCVLLYTQSTLQSCGGGGGSLLIHHQCPASTWMMQRLPQDNGASALTTHQLQVERRERDGANQVDGDY